MEMLDDEDDETPDISNDSRKLSIKRLPCTSHKVLKIYYISSLYANTKSSLGTSYRPESHEEQAGVLRAIDESKAFLY